MLRDQQAVVNLALDYDLVRQYHPDSPYCRLTPASERHARFQAIRAAYDSLRKGDKIGLKNAHLFDEYADEIARRKNIYYKHQQYRNRGPNVAKGHESRYEWNSNADDRWKDHMILGFGIVVWSFWTFSASGLIQTVLEVYCSWCVPGADSVPETHKAAQRGGTESHSS